MKKYLCLLLLVFGLYGFEMQAQWDPFHDSQRAQRPAGNTQYGDRILHIIRSSDAYWEQHNRLVKGSGVKPYERWKYIWEDYGYMNVNPARAWRDAVQAAARPATDDSNWQLAGTTPYTTAGYEGKGRVNVVLIDDQNPQIIYVGAPAGGLWKSTDGGQTFTPLTDDLPTLGVSAIALDPSDHNTIYIGTGDDDARVTPSYGVYRSTDGGQTWTNLTPSINSLDYVSQIIINPSNSNEIVFASSDGVYKSTNGGQNWTLTLNAGIREMRMKPGNFNYLYAVSNTRFYRSTNGGDSFSMVSSGLPSSSNVSRYVMDVTPAAPNNVYVLATNGSSFVGLYKSTNSGSSFTRTAANDALDGSQQTWYDLAMTVSDTDPNIIFLGELNLWKSTNGGASFSVWNDWATMNDRYTHADIHYLEYYGNTLVVGSDGGVYLSTDNGAHFVNKNDDLAISMFYRISAYKDAHSEHIYGGLQDNGGIAKQPDEHWNIYHGADGMDNAVNPSDPQTAYSFIYYGIYLNVTRNGGLTTVGGYSGPSYGNWVTPLAIGADGTLYAGFTKVYKLTGSGWQSVTGSSFSGNIDMLYCHPTNSNVIYAAVNTVLYKSTDAGANFSQLHDFSYNVRAVTLNPQNGKIWVAAGSHVYESTDESTWTDISAGLPADIRIHDLVYHPYSPNETLYLANDIGVYRKTSGNNWEAFHNNLPHTFCMDLELAGDEGKLWVGTYGRSTWVTGVPAYHPDDDAKIAMNGDAGMYCGTLQDVDFRVINNGNNDITHFSYNWDINGETGNASWNGTLHSGDTLSLTITPNNAVSLGVVPVQIQVQYAADQNTQNNTLEYTLTVNKSESASFSYDFESPSHELLTQTLPTGNLWERAHPSGSVLNAAASGTYAYCTNASGTYPDQTTAHLYVPCLDFSQVTSATLGFDMAFDIEQDWDAFYVEYSTDGSTWTVLGSSADPDWYNSSTVQGACQGAQWTGYDSQIRHYSHSLDFLAGEPRVYLRFVMASDYSVHYEGVMLDNLQVDLQLDTKKTAWQTYLNLFPNPTDGRLFVRARRQTVVEHYRILDLSGKILSEKHFAQPETRLDIDVHNLPRGAYILELQTNRGVFHSRFLRR